MGGGERALWAMKRAVSPVSKRVFQAASAAKEDDYCELSAGRFKPVCSRKRSGGSFSGANGLTFMAAPSTPVCRQRRQSRSAVHNRRAASLPLASLVVHWAFASLYPALRALGCVMFPVKRCARAGCRHGRVGNCRNTTVNCQTKCNT